MARYIQNAGDPTLQGYLEYDHDLAKRLGQRNIPRATSVQTQLFNPDKYRYAISADYPYIHRTAKAPNAEAIAEGLDTIYPKGQSKSVNISPKDISKSNVGRIARTAGKNIGWVPIVGDVADIGSGAYWLINGKTPTAKLAGLADMGLGGVGLGLALASGGTSSAVTTPFKQAVKQLGKKGLRRLGQQLTKKDAQVGVNKVVNRFTDYKAMQRGLGKLVNAIKASNIKRASDMYHQYVPWASFLGGNSLALFSDATRNNNRRYDDTTYATNHGQEYQNSGVNVPGDEEVTYTDPSYIDPSIAKALYGFDTTQPQADSMTQPINDMVAERGINASQQPTQQQPVAQQPVQPQQNNIDNLNPENRAPLAQMSPGDIEKYQQYLRDNGYPEDVVQKVKYGYNSGYPEIDDWLKGYTAGGKNEQPVVNPDMQLEGNIEDEEAIPVSYEDMVDFLSHQRDLNSGYERAYDDLYDDMERLWLLDYDLRSGGYIPWNQSGVLDFAKDRLAERKKLIDAHIANDKAILEAIADYNTARRIGLDSGFVSKDMLNAYSTAMKNEATAALEKFKEEGRNSRNEANNNSRMEVAKFTQQAADTREKLKLDMEQKKLDYQKAKAVGDAQQAIILRDSINKSQQKINAINGALKVLSNTGYADPAYLEYLLNVSGVTIPSNVKIPSGDINSIGGSTNPNMRLINERFNQYRPR